MIADAATPRAAVFKGDIIGFAVIGNFSLKHVPRKLIDFCDNDMLQLSEFERFLFGPVIPGGGQAH
jgi:hypothetical protein